MYLALSTGPPPPAGQNGYITQSNLAWSKHINHVSLKISKTIGILYRLKAIYPSAVLQTLYNTLFLLFFNYCILCGEQQLMMEIYFIVYKRKR